MEPQVNRWLRFEATTYCTRFLLIILYNVTDIIDIISPYILTALILLYGIVVQSTLTLSLCLCGSLGCFPGCLPQLDHHLEHPEEQILIGHLTSEQRHGRKAQLKTSSAWTFTVSCYNYCSTLVESISDDTMRGRCVAATGGGGLLGVRGVILTSMFGLVFSNF